MDTIFPLEEFIVLRIGDDQHLIGFAYRVDQARIIGAKGKVSAEELKTILSNLSHFLSHPRAKDVQFRGMKYRIGNREMPVKLTLEKAYVQTVVSVMSAYLNDLSLGKFQWFKTPAGKCPIHSSSYSN